MEDLTYEVSEDLTRLAHEIAESVEELNYIPDAGVTYCVLLSKEKKVTNRKTVYGDCERIKNKYRSLIPYEFIITLYEPNIEVLSDNQIKVLLWHELRHIGVDEETDKRYLAPHDYEDFESITRMFGCDWNHEGQEIADILKGGA